MSTKLVSFYVEEHPITGELIDDMLTVELPAHNEVCPDCRGEGTTYLGWRAKDQPAFTREDFDEEGPDFYYDYMNGEYNKMCEGCEGRRVVKEVDVLNEKHPKYLLYKAYMAHEEDEAHYRSLCDFERRMGC